MTSIFWLNILARFSFGTAVAYRVEKSPIFHVAGKMEVIRLKMALLLLL